MKAQRENTLNEKRVKDPLENAVDILVRDLSYSDALEYCADPMELTRTLERIAALFGPSCKKLTVKEALQKLRAYGIELPVY